MANQIASPRYYCATCGTAEDRGTTYCHACGSTRFVDYPPARIRRPTGVTILGILQVLAGAGSLIFSSAIATLLSVTPFGVLGLGLIAISLLEIIFGAALLTGRNWARILVMILAVLELISFPLGTVIGIVLLIYLTRQRVVAYFKQAA
ncbi:MAG: hypothetical protein KIY11_01410 [Thermoplasmata archaeon]|nr:hypothetical protein [Candidatus Sysuiplasma acidicola]